MYIILLNKSKIRSN